MVLVASISPGLDRQNLPQPPRRRSRSCQCAVCALKPFCLCRRSPTSVEKLSYFPLAAAPATATCLHPSEAKALVPRENWQQ